MAGISLIFYSTALISDGITACSKLEPFSGHFLCGLLDVNMGLITEKLRIFIEIHNSK